MDVRKRNQTGPAAPPVRERAPVPAELDAPPPDHDGFVEASARGLRAVRERREKRRRKV